MTDTLPGCILNYNHPTKPNGPCEKCEHKIICEKCTPKGLLKGISKEQPKCKK